MEKLGGNAKYDIIPYDGIGAKELGASFETNPNLVQITGIDAEAKAIIAQLLANAGYLVMAKLDGSNHVAAVGPQSLNYSSYPETKWAGDKADPYTTGNGYGGDVLKQYPVFVQAGAYTGIINPGNAMSRYALNRNEVSYFIYKPTSGGNT